MVPQPVKLDGVEDRPFARVKDLVCVAQLKCEFSFEHMDGLATAVLMRRMGSQPRTHL